VTFKTFGLTGISVVFALMTMPIIAKHTSDEKYR
jgi:intracellular septation protein A